MIFPFHKVISIIIRVLSRPLIDYTKLYHKGNKIKSPRARILFIYIGR